MSTISSTLLHPENTLCNLEINSKKALLERVARHLHKSAEANSWEDIFTALLARERFGSTGLGHGIAIPHCRLSACTQITTLFAKLAQPIDFDAPDGEAVDLVFVLLVPEQATDEHLDILAKLASIFEQNPCRIALRDCQSNAQLFERMNKMLHQNSE